MKRVFIAVSLAMVACSSEGSPVAPPPPDAAPPEVPDAAPPPPVDAGPPPPVDAGIVDIPDTLLKALGGKSYVEDSCEPTTYTGWPFPAQKCTYMKNLVVTIANPEPERVAKWIIAASRLIPALDGLKTRDRTNWEAGLVVIAKHTINQSSRIFPLEGQVYENGTAYKFERGVTKTCSSGCYCRINSTSRQQWCAYAANVLKTETEDACLQKYGMTSKTLTEPWLAHCLQNHVDSWNADSNEHYLAQAWNANNDIAPKFPNPASASAADVITALKAEYP